MGDWTIERYSTGRKEEWDGFARMARNSSFIFLRDYMDYHSDRFTDCSLMAFHKGKLRALLPADIKDDILASHRGLTYGGWILAPHKTDGTAMMDLFDCWLQWCRSAGIRETVYKPLPYIYALEPSQEDLYALWRHGFTLDCTNLSSTIRNGEFAPDTMRRRHLRHAETLGIRVGESDDFDSFWEILEGCLQERHNALPVHTIEEIKLLHSRFPDNIRLFATFTADGSSSAETCGTGCDGSLSMESGTVVFDNGITAHCQYIASTERARREHHLAQLFRQLVTGTFASRPYFDFGTSNENDGNRLNAGLLANKFGYGATGVAYQRYRLQL